ncbi:MAG: hypothetical protein IKG21_11525 [Atopobiaceae bacterium]|nr:hypothetical protein [Atopobiaceae bacterium]
MRAWFRAAMSILLAVAMPVGMVPTSVFAEASEDVSTVSVPMEQANEQEVAEQLWQATSPIGESTKEDTQEANTEALEEGLSSPQEENASSNEENAPQANEASYDYDLSWGNLHLERDVVSSVDHLGITVVSYWGETLSVGTDYELVFFEDAYSEDAIAVPTAAGEYYVAAQGTGDEQSGYWGTTSRTAFTIRDAIPTTELALGQAVKARIRETNDYGSYSYCWAGKFTAPEAGSYDFYVRSNDDTYGFLSTCMWDTYAVQWNDEEYTGEDSGTSWTQRRYLAAGETIYVKLFADNVASATVRVKQTNVKDLSLARLELGRRSFVLPEDIVFEQTVTDVNGNLVDPSCYELVYYRIDEQGEYDEYGDYSEYYEHTQVLAPTEPGSYCVAAQGVEGDTGYTGETNRESFEVADSVDLGSDYWSYAFENWENQVCEVEYSPDGVVLPKAIVYHDEEDARAVLEEGIDFELANIEYSGYRAVADTREIQGPGLYTVHYVAIGDAHTGSFSLMLRVMGDGNDLSQGSIRVNTWQYDEWSVEVECEVYDCSDEIVWSDDYDLVFYDAKGNVLGYIPSSSGTYKVRAKAKSESGLFGETPMVEFDIVGNDHIGGDRYSGSLAPDIITYTGKPIRWPKPSLFYYDDDGYQVDLEYGADYVLDRYEDARGNVIKTSNPPSKPGVYYAYFEGAGGYYTGNRRLEFEIADPHDIGSGYWNYCGFIDHGEVYPHTGQSVALAEAEILHSDDDTEDAIRLKQGEAFELKEYHSATNGNVVGKPTKVGDYYAVYQGIGSYTGEVSIGFRIADASSLSYASLELSRSVVTSVSELGPIVTDLAGNKLTSGTDYELVFFDDWSYDDEIGVPSEPGYYRVMARAKNGNSSGYTSETNTCRFELREPVEGIVNIRSNREYVASFWDQEDWIGRFTALESAVYEFSITGDAYGELYSDQWRDKLLGYCWASSGRREDSRIVRYLNAGEIAYLFVSEGFDGWGDVARGATVCVRKISNKDLKNGFIYIEGDEFKYTGKQIKPRVYVYDSLQNTLKKGVDYTVSYTGNVNAGRATVTMKGIGKYAGSLSATFKINKVASKVSLATQTKAYNGKAQSYSGKVTRSGSGGKVTYAYYSDAKCTKAVKAANVKNAGTYYVKAKLAADTNHNAAVSAAVKLTISRAKVAAPKATNRPYTGKQQVGVPAGKGYALKGIAKATKAGTYTVTATPDANHRWADGKTNARKLTWKIVAPSVTYQTHVQGIGDQGWKSNGKPSGTFGQSKRLEGIWIKLSKKPVSGSIRYRTHVQGIGDQEWRREGQMSGTHGQSKRLEAIQIELTGNMAKTYDVYYRVHAQRFGWMGWAKNGGRAGTAGYSYRLEAIQIVLVPKGSKAPVANYGGYQQMTQKAFARR